ncbi:MAG: hypothetical protein ABJI96_04520 [Paracoccaceae bacterium]
MTTLSISRPKMTMPKEVAAFLKEQYARSDVILEYGAGGSTVMAGQMKGKHVTSVESDRQWWHDMKVWFDANPAAPGTTVNLIHANVGPTEKWGKPKNERMWKRFPNYPLGVWHAEGFRAPDVVLVDGRFRVGCALATAFQIDRDTTLLMDDYGDRKRLHVVEEFLGAPRLVGRMAEFHLKPQAFPKEHMLHILKFMLRP